MTDTMHEQPPPPAGFDPQRLRTVTHMERSRDDRMIAGVCGGVARYLDVDPVVVRVITAALTVVGGVGIVLYVAAWLLAPLQGESHSIVGRLTRRPDGGVGRMRTVGFAIAGAVAIIAVATNDPWSGWWSPFPLAVIAVLLWLFLRRRDSVSAPATVADDEVSPPARTPESASGSASRRSRRPSRGDGSLTWLTIGAALIAAGVMWLVDRAAGGVEWPDYVALELAVVGVGVLIGIWRGNGRRLIPFGIVLALVLLGSTQLPVLSTGEVRATPLSAADVQPSYQLGAGSLRLDLTQVTDMAALDGRTVSIEQGMGEVRVLVPDEMDVTVAAHIDMGDIKVFEREVAGWDSTLDWVDGDPSAGPDVRLVIESSLGEVKVMNP
ncbi:MAG: PspC domain-containing protein [Nocardioidaceae bacterium]|nr:PspC domain-containing protein [Nocardioidaceae bacterium]